MCQLSDWNQREKYLFWNPNNLKPLNHSLLYEPNFNITDITIKL